MAYVPPPPGATLPGQPTPPDIPKQDVHIADLPPEVRKSFLLSMIFFPSIVGATICAVIFLGWWTIHRTKAPTQYAIELRSSDPRARWEAARELGENLPTFEDAYAQQQANAPLSDVKFYDSQTLSALLEIVQNPELDKESDNWSPTAMIKGNEEREPGLRCWAARMAGHFAARLPGAEDKDRTVKVLVQALDDEKVAVYAARGLSLLKDSRARAPLVGLLEKGKTPDLQASAANALGAIGEYALVSKAAENELELFKQPLRAAFERPGAPPLIRDNAAISLARLRDHTGEKRLIELTRDEDAVIRDNAARALKLLNAKE